MARSDDYRYIAVDMDGTVLDASYQASPRVVAALDELRSSGRKIIVSTGRVFNSASPQAAKIGGADGYVCSNGAEVHDGSGRLLIQKLLPDAASASLVAISRRHGSHFHGFVGNEWRYEAERPYTALYAKRSGYSGTKTSFAEVAEFGFTKCIFMDDPEPLAVIEGEIHSELGGSVRTVYSAPFMLEIVAAGVGKASGLADCLAAWGGTLAQTVAFGDAENDEDMLLAAGIGVAMGNAPEALKTRVGRTTLSVDEDGVAVWLKEFFGLRA
jgi:Cof subfamily protein (haloacid dehalogenase superfamily)